MDPHQPVLTLALLPAELEFVVDNPRTETLVIWHRENSWGWPTLEVEVCATDTDEWLRLTPSPRRWTRNGPRPIEIAPGGQHRFVVAGGAAAPWEGIDGVRALGISSLQVRGTLRIPPSDEAAEHGVFVGVVSSPTYRSSPPHGWLLPT